MAGARETTTLQQAVAEENVLDFVAIWQGLWMQGGRGVCLCTGAGSGSAPAGRDASSRPVVRAPKQSYHGVGLCAQ